MKRTALIAVLCVVGCQGRTAPPPSPTPTATAALEPSFIRVVHAIPGGGPVDVLADDQRILTSVSYKTVSDYQSVSDNQVTFKLMASAQSAGEPLAENRELMSDGSEYTLVALPADRGAAAEIRILTDKVDPPSDGKARVRVVNAVPDVAELDVLFRGQQDPVVSGLNSADDVGYRDVVAGSGVLEVRDKAKRRLVAQAAKASIVAGRNYTLILVGRATGTPKAELIVIEDGRAAHTGSPSGTPDMSSAGSPMASPTGTPGGTPPPQRP